MTDTIDTLQRKLTDVGVPAVVVTERGIGVINKSKMSPSLHTMVEVLKEPKLIESPDEIELIYELALDHFNQEAHVTKVGDDLLEHVDEVVNAQDTPTIAIVQSAVEDIVLSFNIKYSIRDNGDGDHTILRFIRHLINDFGLNIPNFVQKCRQISNTTVH